MAYLFDIFGWYAGEGTGRRSTETAPGNLSTAETDGVLRANWTGHAWIEMPYAHRATPGPVEPVPEAVTRFQARAALHLAGHLAAIEAIMADPQTDMLARLAWQDALQFERDSPTVAAMSAALGLTPAQVDALFRTAAGILA